MIAPGFVDAHIHIESSMLPPAEFARWAVRHGTVATVSDPHEIANVLGVAGVDHMIRDGRRTPFKFNFGAPSCVPATGFETAGAALDTHAVARLLARKEIKCLSEVMNFPGVLDGDVSLKAMIATARKFGKPIDGHAPELVLRDVKPVGYHAWADDHTLALFVLGSPATLQLADAGSGRAAIVVTGITRSIQRMPDGAISFVQRGGADGGTLSIRALDPKTKAMTLLVDAVAGAREADCAWTPDGLLLMADKDVLYGWKKGSGQTAWRRLADLAALGLHGVTRIAISPAGDRIAFVTDAPRR